MRSCGVMVPWPGGCGVSPERGPLRSRHSTEHGHDRYAVRRYRYLDTRPENRPAPCTSELTSPHMWVHLTPSLCAR